MEPLEEKDREIADKIRAKHESARRESGTEGLLFVLEKPRKSPLLRFFASKIPYCTFCSSDNITKRTFTTKRTAIEPVPAIGGDWSVTRLYEVNYLHCLNCDRILHYGEKLVY